MRSDRENLENIRIVLTSERQRPPLRDRFDVSQRVRCLDLDSIDDALDYVDRLILYREGADKTMEERSRKP